MLTEGTKVKVAPMAELYELGAVSEVVKHGEYSMAGKVMVATIDPSEPPGFKRLLDIQWFDPAEVREL